MSQIFFLTSIVLLGVLSRIFPHAPNFTPIGAIALFSGFYFKNRNFALLPLVIMALSDLLISGYYGPVMFYVYGSFFAIFLIGRLFLRSSLSPRRLLSASLLSSGLFFAITNFAVWLHTGLYPKDLAGLFTCYLAALPFFRNTLLGDLFYNSVFFAAYSFAAARQKTPASRKA